MKGTGTMVTGAVTVERSGTRTLARLSGKLDQELVDRLDAELGDAASVVLALAQVDYVSSSGLAGLVRLSTQTDLRLAALPERVRHVFGLAGLDKILAIFDDEAQAIAAPKKTRRA